MQTLKCSSCADEAIANDFTADDVPDAVLIVTVMQTFNVPGGQQVAAPVTMGICWACRKGQLGVTSKSGLMLG